MANITTKQKDQKPAGFKCPQCSFFIEMSIQSLLFEDNHKCPGCSTVFTLNRGASRDALQLVQKLHVATKNMDMKDKFNGQIW